ncbi:hypothetical protein [Rhodococcus sp. NPDC127528]|uniref:hypothetical protein n=1 Tax=unclassified Rhodococcus (in: high G+C Gram-positive bacteria) TaxID=192944 RepID=UPI00362E090F
MPDLPWHASSDDPDLFRMTPRQMWVAHDAATSLAQDAYRDIAEHGDAPVTVDATWSVFAAYPPQTWNQHTGWRRQAARAFDDLADDIDAGRQPHPRCTGEEMALHLILRRARTLHRTGLYVDDLIAMPEHPSDSDWESPRDFLFEDLDVLTLFDGDGPADGLHLDPPNWFTPFEADLARDPHRGFHQ